MEEVDSRKPASLAFDEILSRLEAERRLPQAVSRTADYLVTASLLDEDRDVLLQARDRLKTEDPRALFAEFLRYCISELKSADKVHQYRYARQLNDVAVMGLGIWQEDLGITACGRESLALTGEPDWEAVKNHIDRTVLGEYFINTCDVPADSFIWGGGFPLRMSACDASQHRFKLRVPFHKTWATPVIVNNSGGTIKEDQGGRPRWSHVAVPRDTQEYEDWVILGPDDYADMDEGDYEWAAKSSMDVGEFFVEETFIFRHGGLALKPDVHFRDGRIFPQDHLMNARIENRHGQLTREAIYRMSSTCRAAEDLDILYCGVAKQVQLKVYSTVVNWYITRVMNKAEWNPTGQIINDSEIMRHLIFDSGFAADTFGQVLVTCPIVRRFETASNLNRRTRIQMKRDLDSLGRVFHSRSLTARDIVEEALKISVVMFFVGHSRTDELYVPRYEFATYAEGATDRVEGSVVRVLSAMRLASFDADEDHLWGLEEPTRTLVPTPILVAHDISKRMGEELASTFAQKAIAEFTRRLREKRGVS